MTATLTKKDGHSLALKLVIRDTRSHGHYVGLTFLGRK